MCAVPALRYNTYRGSIAAHIATGMQLMVRKKGGKKMNKGRQRIEIIPLWRKEPDAQLVALAVVEMARQRRQLASKAAKGETPRQGGTNG